jgi:23S rRNA (guanosine2251-2'-O)-methyltransferase
MKNSFRLIMGRNCISELLSFAPERIVEIHTSQKHENDSLCQECLKQKIPIFEKSKKQLSQMVESESHQGFVAAVKERGHPTVKDFLEKNINTENSLVLMLDSIYDPQNLGAILRASECFGVDLVIYSKNRGTDITPTVTKASAGASELVPICKVSNLADTMQLFQEEGYHALSADVGEKAQNLYQFKFPEKTLIIMGSEGKGIQPLLRKKCDYHVTIPMYGRIDSLNVSQATSIILNSYRSLYAREAQTRL